MAANIIIKDVAITPNPVQAGGKYKISVSAECVSSLAFVGQYVGAYVNIGNSEMQEKLALSYVGDFTKG